MKLPQTHLNHYNRRRVQKHIQRARGTEGLPRPVVGKPWLGSHMRLFGPLSVALPQNTTCGRAHTVRLKLRGPCPEVGFWPGRVYFEEVALEEVGGVGRAMGDTAPGRRARFMHELRMGELEGVDLSERTSIRLRTFLAKASLGVNN
uniref:Uncharacterized protein n=1 Tax=Myotis myotis TaxID=51298 RepID=A0A7J7VIM9_MYOMY|nr:hypothetical protein mMyoMyo1_008314 [Myotis myotis]